MKRWCAFFLSLALLFPLSGCARHPDAKGAAENVISALSLPAGQLYVPSALSHEEGYLSPSLRLALFGEEGERLFSSAEDGALFLGLSAEEPLEFALFRFPTHALARRAAGIFSARLSLLRRLCPTAQSLIGAGVWIFGTWAIYTVLPDNEGARNALARLL